MVGGPARGRWPISARSRRTPPVNPRSPRLATSWHLYLLAAVAAVVLVTGIMQIGPPTSSARTSRETVQAEDGVVQTTVSGTGNVEPATDLAVNFATSGTLQSVDVSVGQHVNKGQLLATLDPTSATLALDQAKANLTAAKDNLTAAEQGTSSGSGSGSSATAASLQTTGAGTTEFVGDTTTTPTTPTTTTPSKTKKHKTTKKRASPSRTSGTNTTSRTPTTALPSSTTSSGAGSTHTTSAAGATTSTTTTPSPSQIASAKASVDSAQATVDSAEATLADTKLYAPVSGTIASLESINPGQTVSATGSGSSATSGSNASSGSSSSGSGSQTAGSLAGSSSSSSSSTSSNTGFAEIINSGTLTMTVAFSESDISSVKVGQAATVSIDALSGVELGGHVTAISPVGTTSSSVVSYDATITLDENDSKVRPGMSASATVITAQAQGVTVPNQAISGSGSSGTVQLERGGKTVSQQVVVGLRGSTRSQIVSGVKAGDQLIVTVTLPALGTSTSSGSSSTGTLGGGLTGRGFGGGGFAGGGFPRGGFAGGAGGG